MDPTTPPWRSLDAPSTPVPTPASARGAHDRVASDVVHDGITVSPATLRIGVTVAIAVLLGVVAFMVAASGGAASTVEIVGGSPLAGDALATTGESDATGGGELVLEIVGAVQQPGVFRLPAGSRVGDLITAAGGYGPRVDTVRAAQELNLATTLRDGDQVRVPSRDDIAVAAGPGAASGPGGGEAGDGPLDLNRATAAELDALPGIGPVTIEKILTSRDEAPFQTVEDLRSRGLVGEKTFEKVRDALTVP
jgi:competence protein ComEA